MTENTRLTEEQIANRTKWVEALRSGKYIQGNNYLKSEVNGVTEHCCLGVAVEALGIGFDVNPSSFKAYDLLQRPNKKCFPITTQPRLNYSLSFKEDRALTIDLRNKLGVENQGDLIRANDVLKKSFSEIADIIEQDTLGIAITISNPISAGVTNDTPNG